MVRILCWNVNGWSATREKIDLKYGSIECFFQSVPGDPPSKLDIVCLQEVKIAEEKLSKEACIVPGYESYWSCSAKRKGYSGVGTFSKAKMALSCEKDCLEGVDMEKDALKGEGRIVTIDIGPCVVVNVYVPNAGLGKSTNSNFGDGKMPVPDSKTRKDAPSRLEYKLEFLNSLHARCKQYIEDGKEVILVGDFNVAVDVRDTHPSIPLDKAFTEKERYRFSRFLQNEMFVDVFRYLHPNEMSTFTCFDERTNARERNAGVRIDYVLVTKGLLAKVKTCEVVSGNSWIPHKWSDHFALLLDIDLDIPDRQDEKSCVTWSRLYSRLVDSKQRTILSMFARKNPKEGSDDTKDSAKKPKLK